MKVVTAGSLFLAAAVFVNPAFPAQAVRVAVHPQAFDAGGWKLDVQFMDEMGSPMLLAHGAGVPVADAQATVSVPEAGEWRVRVRARNWADGNPGAFKVRIGGTTLAKTFGVSQREWAGEDGGTVTLAMGETTVALRDLTGFEGRCAGVLLEKGDGLPPLEGALSVADEKPVETITTSFCIVGGGIPGCAAALAAARSGVKTVLVNDRPYLGGNASREIRIWCAGEGISQPIIRSLRGYFYNGDGGAWTGDDRRIALLTREENIDLRLSTRAFGVTKTADGRIASVKAIDWKRNRVIEIKADLFLDATGDGWIGAYAGADWRMGREAKGETGESMAPDKADGDPLGASLVWSSRRGTADVPFSAPWAEPHAQGVVAVAGDWNWEYGIHRDMVADAEGIRDRLFLAIYGSFSLAKKDPANARNVLDNVPFLLGKRESRRLMGDHLFCEKDVVERIPHPDAIAKCSWPIDLHFDDAKPGIDFQTRCTSGMHGRSYVPFRSIYSRNVANLMMAGRCFSCTHVGLGSPRVINTLAQMGVAAGYAAMICGREGILPRELGKRGLVREIQRLMGGDWPGNPDPAHAKWTFVDDEDESVRFGKGWVCNHMCNGEQFGEKAHVLPPKARKGAEPAVYPLPVAKKGRYRLHAKSPFQPWPVDTATGSAAFEIASEGKVTEIQFNQYLDQGTWRAVGDFDLAPGATLTIVPAKSTAKSDLFADGFALEPL